MKNRQTLIVSCFVALLPMMAMAQFGEQQSQPGSENRDVKTFQQLDKDQDGALNESEASEAEITSFSDADKNDDGKVDAREYYSAIRGDDPQNKRK